MRYAPGKKGKEKKKKEKKVGLCKKMVQVVHRVIKFFVIIMFENFSKQNLNSRRILTINININNGVYILYE